MHAQDYPAFAPVYGILFLLLTAFSLVYIHFCMDLWSTRLSDGTARYIPRVKLPQHKELPFDGDVHATYSALRHVYRLNPDNGILGTYLFRWVREGVVQIVERDAHRAPVIAIRLMGRKTGMTALESRLYELLEYASKRTGLVEERDFEEWSSLHRLGLIWWQWDCGAKGVEKLQKNGCMEVVRGEKFLGCLPIEDGNRLTPIGLKKTIQALGFWNCAADAAVEVPHGQEMRWDGYLEYALFLGVAEQMESRIRQADPERYRRYQAGWRGYSTANAVAICQRLAAASASGIAKATRVTARTVNAVGMAPSVTDRNGDSPRSVIQ